MTPNRTSTRDHSNASLISDHTQRDDLDDPPASTAAPSARSPTAPPRQQAPTPTKHDFLATSRSSKVNKKPSLADYWLRLK